MKTVSNRQLRRTVVSQQKVLEDGVAPAIRAVAQNEEATRARVARLEQTQQAWTASTSTWWGRLGWILRGYSA